ncbi:MAG: hypothetical protein ACTHLH_07830 [Solirubrobacterales bacterium]
MGAARVSPINELVHWIIHSRFLSSDRLPSFAGSGLPERMRSMAFALLGLTAAAGLVLVAIFAHLGFPLLEPAPLPDEPTVSESVGNAEKVKFGHSPSALVAATPVVLPHRGPSSAAGHPARGSSGSSTGTNQTIPAPAGVAAPIPVSVPEPSPSGEGGGGGNGGGPGGGSSPAPTATPEPAPVAPPTPPPASKPTGSAPAPVPASPPPAPAAPGHSSSAAAAAHASERGIEASSKSVPSTVPPPAAPAEPPAPPTPPGHAYAKGHDK